MSDKNYSVQMVWQEHADPDIQQQQGRAAQRLLNSMGDSELQEQAMRALFRPNQWINTHSGISRDEAERIKALVDPSGIHCKIEHRAIREPSLTTPTQSPPPYSRNVPIASSQKTISQHAKGAASQQTTVQDQPSSHSKKSQSVMGKRSLNPRVFSLHP